MSTTVEEEEKTIGNKLKVLKLTHEGSDKIVGTKSLKQIQRHRKLLESKLEECHEITRRTTFERGAQGSKRAWRSMKGRSKG